MNNERDTVSQGNIVSVIVPSLRPQDLRECLESIHTNAAGIDYEVVVVSPFDIEPHPNVVHIKESEPGGTGKAIACGFQQARGEYIMHWPDKCRPKPGCVANMIAFMRPHDNEIFEGRFQHFDKANPKHDNQSTVFGRVFATLMCMRKDKAESIGGFLDYPYYRAWFLDPDLSLRVWRAGGTVETCPNAAVLVLPRPTGDGVFRNNKAKYFESDAAAFSKRWGNWRR